MSVDFATKASVTEADVQGLDQSGAANELELRESPEIGAAEVDAIVDRIGPYGLGDGTFDAALDVLLSLLRRERWESRTESLDDLSIRKSPRGGAKRDRPIDGLRRSVASNGRGASRRSTDPKRASVAAACDAAIVVMTCLKDLTAREQSALLFRSIDGAFIERAGRTSLAMSGGVVPMTSDADARFAADEIAAAFRRRGLDASFERVQESVRTVARLLDGLAAMISTGVVGSPPDASRRRRPRSSVGRNGRMSDG